MHRFKDLQGWQKDVEQYELTNPINKSVVSMASHVMEGTGRNTTHEFNHLSGIRSSFELNTLLIIAAESKYPDVILPPLLMEEGQSVENRLYKRRQSS